MFWTQRTATEASRWVEKSYTLLESEFSDSWVPFQVNFCERWHGCLDSDWSSGKDAFWWAHQGLWRNQSKRHPSRQHHYCTVFSNWVLLPPRPPQDTESLRNRQIRTRNVNYNLLQGFKLVQAFHLWLSNFNFLLFLIFGWLLVTIIIVLMSTHLNKIIYHEFDEKDYCFGWILQLEGNL